MNGAGLGALASGLTAGYLQGENLKRADAREKRDEERFRRDTEREDRHKKAFAQLADLAESYAGVPKAGVPAGPQNAPAPSGPAAGINLDAKPVDDASPPVYAAPTPATAASSGIGQPPMPPATPPQEGPKTPTDRIGYTLFRQPGLLSNPEFLNKAAGVFLKSGMPEGVAWLERGARAQKENYVESIKKLLADDPQGAEAAFNASGKARIVPGSAKKLEDGRWQLEMEGGGTKVLDPKLAMRSLLSPAEYFTIANKEQSTADLSAYHDRTTNEQSRHNKAVEENQRYNADLKVELAQLRQARGEATETAMIRNIKYLTESGVAKDPSEAFAKLHTAMQKPDEEALLSISKNLMRGSGYQGRDGASKATNDAKVILQSLRSGTQQGAPAVPGGAPPTRFKSADEVRAAFNAGKLDRAGAIKELGSFGYKQE